MNAAVNQSVFPKLIGVLLFGVMPAMLVVVAASNFVTAHVARQETAEKADLRTRLETRLRDGVATGMPLDTANLYLEGASLSLAGAVLRERVVGAIASANGKLIETRAEDNAPIVLNAETTDVALNVTFDIGNEGLAHFLYDIESGMPLLTIKEVAVRRSIATQAETETDPLLRVDMLVKGNWMAYPK